MMNTSRLIFRLAFVSVFVAVLGLGVVGQSQQSAPPISPEEEFLDAIRKGNSARVSELLKEMPTLNTAKSKNGATAVLLAVYARHPEIAELLLATGIEPNVFEAAATGRLERLRELVGKSSELATTYSPDGWTALHLNFGNLQVVKVLLDSGADINAVSKNKLSATPLQGAAAMQNLELGRLLIERGANVNCRGEGGGTPLHEASANGEVDFAKMLLAHGANINAKDDNGKTPLTIALESKQAEMIKFLRERQAK